MAASGDRGAALVVYEKFAERLRAELRTVPSPATLELVEAVRSGTAATHTSERRGAEQGNGAHAPAEPESGELPTGVVTFLLTDIEGSTRLWEARPDVMAAALELHDELIADAVGLHGGRLLKQQGEGDGTLTVFRRASEAVACAADLQAALKAASWPGGLDLRVRIALHTGEAYEREGDYFGAALNRAARLRAWARGGAIVVSQATAEIVRDGLPNGVQLIDLGPHKLRDLARPERVFGLRAHADEDERRVEPVRVRLAVPRPLRFPAEHPFVGRDTELARLRELWAQAPADARPAVFVAGEAGIGKTRLAAELAGELQRDGALVLYGRCDEGLSVPYQPFVEALRPYTTAIGPDRIRAELGLLAPHLGRLLPELQVGAPARGDPESERFALFDAVSALLKGATREQRALLIPDDLHWAASPTLLLLRHLLRSDRPVGVLVLGTYRDTELNSTDALQQLLADLQRDASAAKVSIGGLEDRAIAALLDAIAGTSLDERTSELVRLIQFQTGGNTFFIREFLAHLCETGAINQTRQRRADDLRAAELWVPEGLRDVIRHRVARLSEPARRALGVAAVAGPTFSLVVIERVLGEAAGILDALDEAADAGLLTETGPAAYAFTHALVRQAIYGALSATRRMRLHRQLGEALETLDDPGAHIEALANHFAQSAADGQSVKAAIYALAAGRSATARLGYEDAAAHYERGLQALEVSGQPQEQRRCELLLALGEARWEASEIEMARQAYRQAAELAEWRGDATALAHAALGYCGHSHEAAAEATRLVAGLLQRALAALSDDDSALRARLMGRVAAYSDLERRQPALARQALEMARRVADKTVLADVLSSALMAIRGPDARHESLALTRELGRVADEIGDRRLRAFAHWWLLDHLLELGDFDAVQLELEALQRLVRTRRERAYTWVLAVIRANDAFLGGRLDDCEKRAHEALALARRVGADDAFAAQIFALQIFFVHREQGRVEQLELVKTLEDLAAQYPRMAAWRCALAGIYARLERIADARQALDALARADFKDLPRDSAWLPCLSALTDAVVVLDDVPRARLLYELLLPYAERCVVTAALLCHGSVSHRLALLAATLSRYQDAARHFEQALKMNAQIRSPVLIAHTQHDYARMLLVRNDPGDRDKALELLNQALATAEELGLEALANKTRPLKLTAEAPGTQIALPRSP